MFNNNYISSACTISKNTVYLNSKKLFENHGADLPAFLLSVYQHFQLNYPKFYKMDNLSKLGWLTSEILLQNGFEKENYQPEEIGVVLVNANSSLDNDLKYFETIKDIASPSLFVYTLPNIVIGEICIRNHFKGEHAFFIQETFDAKFITQQVNYLLDEQILKVCICGWVDVLEADYKSALFLVEKTKGENVLLFSEDNMNLVFNN